MCIVFIHWRTPSIYFLFMLTHRLYLFFQVSVIDTTSKGLLDMFGN